MYLRVNKYKYIYIYTDIDIHICVFASDQTTILSKNLAASAWATPIRRLSKSKKQKGVFPKIGCT